MHILFISCNFPENPETSTHGVYGRMRTLLKGLAASGASLTVLFFVHDPAPYIGADKALWHQRLCHFFGVEITLQFAPLAARKLQTQSVKGILAGAVSFFKQESYARMSGAAQVSALDAALASQVDLVFVHRLAAMPPLLLTQKRLPRVFLDMDDIEHVAFMREITQPPVWRSKYLRYLQVPALMAGERRAIRLTEKTLVCSPLDVKKLGAFAGRGQVVALPNSVVMPPLTSPAAQPTLLFLGTFTYLPNVRAVEYMLNAVWAHVLAAVPHARFVVGGIEPQNIAHFASPPPQVEFAGYLPDLNAAYRDARAVVCPILSGGGTRVKIVEAAAHGRAIVSTTLGAEGLEFEPKSEILIADTAEQFAALCVRVLQDHAYARQVGLAARAKAETVYDRASVVKQLASWVSGV